MEMLIELGTSYGAAIEVAVWSIIGLGTAAIAVFATKGA